VVDQLNQQAVRIMEVKRAGAVAVCLWFCSEWDALAAQLCGPLIDFLRPADNEADVMDRLDSTRLLSRRQLMKRQVILTRREVRIFRIWHPFQFHPENVRIKFHGLPHIPHIQGDMPDAQYR